MQRWQRVLVAVVIVAAALVATTPWWSRAALAIAAPRLGVRYAAYERIGYTRFALRDVEWRDAAASVRIGRVEGDQLFVWVWRRFTGGPGEVRLEKLRIESLASSDSESKLTGWLDARAQVRTALARLEPWLPRARVTSGEFVWLGQSVRFAGAEWDRGRLQLQGVRHREANVDAVAAWEAADDVLRLEATEMASGVRLALTERRGAVEGRLVWQEQTARLAARFDETGWIPTEASCVSDGFQIPAAALRLGGGYADVRGQGRLEWRQGRLTVALEAKGAPAPGTKAPEIEVDVRGAGDRSGLNVEALNIALPGLLARLSEPVRIGADGAMPKSARFALEADLAAQPWWGLPARGKATGEARVQPREADWPVVDAELTLRDVATAEWSVTQGQVNAQLTWPQLTVSSARVTLAGGDELELAGTWNWTERRLGASRITGRAGQATLARWLPAGVRADGVEFSAEAEGVWPDLIHHGSLQAKTVAASPLRPQALHVAWEGRGATLPRLEAETRRDGALVELAGALEAEAWRIDRLVLHAGDNETWQLQAPVRVARRAPWSVSGFVFKSPSGEISADAALGPEGRAKLSVRGLGAETLRPLLELPEARWHIAQAILTADWRNGPASWALDATGRLQGAEDWSAEIAIKAKGDGDGATVESVRVSEAGQAVATAQGRWPVAIWPHQQPVLRWTSGADWSLTADTVPDSPFWDHLNTLSGVSLTRPKLAVDIRGAGRSVKGEAAVTIEKLALDEKRFGRAWPEISNLSARLRGDDTTVRLEDASASLAGQVIRAHGWVPITAENWPDLREDPARWIRREGELVIELPSAEIAALARFVPEHLAPIGRMEAHLAFRPGREVEGTVRLEGAATRPLGDFGALQEIGAELTLRDRTLEVSRVSALIGGQPVRVAGRTTWNEDGRFAFDLSLQGENVPLIRQVGLLVRSNLDLTLKTTGEKTRLQGSVTLRDSLLLSDVRDFLRRGGGNARSRRAPYFSIEQAPFDAWELDLTVSGARFMRLRTPVFNGVVSAKLRFDGTLRDPRALGEITVDEGRVMLPFAAFTVQEGRVRLSQADPQQPRVNVTGTGRRLGYELRLEVTGPVESPHLTFSSTPPLESSQILLMVMAGEAPQQEVAYTGRQRVTRLGTYLGQGLLGQLGGDPTQADRLSVTSGEKVSRQGRETYDVEYQLTPKWSLTGEYDEFDEYNIGVRRRFRGKEPEREADKP